jgi:hypothetical protein
VATDDALLAQTTVRPPSGFPFESLSVAVSSTVPPTGTFADGGRTVTKATGTSVTVIVDVPLPPSLVAVIVAVPVAAPVTRPLPFTDATVVFELAHVTVRPVNGLPPASFGVAVNCTTSPT